MEPHQADPPINAAEVQEQTFIRRPLKDSNRPHDLQSASQRRVATIPFVHHERRIHLNRQANRGRFPRVKIGQ